MSKSSQAFIENIIDSPAFLSSQSQRICPDSNRLVVKLGGSLFDLPDLNDRISALLNRFDGPIILVPGGGQFAAELRRLDSIHHWSEQHAHYLGLQAMSFAARMIAGSDSRFQLIHAAQQPLWSNADRQLRVLDVVGLPSIEDLPATWNVTSDSIAAWIALRYGSGRLLMAKSISLPEPVPTFQTAAEIGLVDRSFPQFAVDLNQLQWVNLRDSELRVQSWTMSSQELGHLSNECSVYHRRE